MCDSTCAHSRPHADDASHVIPHCITASTSTRLIDGRQPLHATRDNTQPAPGAAARNGRASVCPST